MKLVPLSAEHIQGHAFLPFNVYAANGRLLLQARTQLSDPRVRTRLSAQGELFVQPQDYDAWRRGVAKAVEGTVHANEVLGNLARARPTLIHKRSQQLPGEDWEGLLRALQSALQAASSDASWLSRVLEVRDHARVLAARRVDEALFHLIWTGGNRTTFYSCRQLLRCMLIAGEAARVMGWSPARLELLDMVTLTMNVASWQLQDQLARHPKPIAEGPERQRLDTHPEEGAQLLQAAGVTDPDWLEAVRLHHDDNLTLRPMAELSAGQQMARLVRCVDRYGAMLSRRISRDAHNAVVAARHACLGPDGRPHEVGALLLKTVGLYPPGSFVTLASKEMGIVLARGSAPTHPLVAALLNAQGMAMAEPRLRNTAQRSLAVNGALRHSQVNMDPPLGKLQILRNFVRAQAVSASVS